MILNIGIDIGAVNARMVVKGRGLALNQPSACAFKNGAPFAVGDEAYALWGREFGGVEVAFPLTAGIISREDALEAWLRHIIGQASSMGLARISRVLIAKPVMMSSTQTQRYAALAMRAGAASCALISSDILTALGEDIDIKKPRGAFVMNVGASQTTATVLVRSKIISSGCLALGMDSANDMIIRMVRDKYSLKIGPAAAEAVKRSLADASPNGAAGEPCAGFDLIKGFPAQANVNSRDIRDCLEPLIEKARQLAMAVLGECEAQVQSDILEDGARLTGGAARLYGLAQALQNATGVPFAVGENPDLSAARGLIKVLEAPDDYEGCMEAQQTLFDKRTPGR